MFIEELELVGYNRLNLNQFKKIKLKFNKKVQVILGTNGSGKSSILVELSPLPAEAKNFSKSGKKRIVIKHNKKRYILTSSFSPTSIHSFVIEGEEDLNPGGTITVQKALVKQHFGIDSVTHALAIGKHKFHAMPSNQRRDWFKLLSDNNFDYALSVFKKLKERHRDIVGTLNTTKDKLVSFTSKLMPENALKALEQECEELYKIVELMIEHRQPLTAPIENSERVLQVALQSLEDDSKYILKLCSRIDANIKLGVVDDLKDAQSVEYFIKNRLQEIQTKKVDLYQKHKENSGILEIHEKTKLYTVASISTNLERLKEIYNEELKKKAYQFTAFDPVNSSRILNDISPELLRLTMELEPNINQRFSREKFQTLSKEREDNIGAIGVLKASVRNFEESIEHLQEHQNSPDVECPKCQHRWKPLFNELKVKELKDKILKATIEINHRVKVVEDLEVYITDFNKWVQTLNQIKDLASSNGLLSDFWSLIMKQEVIFTNPKSVSLIVMNYSRDLLIDKMITEVENQINEELEKLQLTENIKGSDYITCEANIKNIEFEMSSLSEEELRYNSIKDVVSQLARDTKNVQERTTELEKNRENLDEIYKCLIEDRRRALFNEVLRSFQSDLALKERAINEERGSIATLENLKQEIVQYEETESALKAALKELSPTEGIIAEGLFGYMKLFIKKMNKFIASMWTYPLIVKPCSTEEDKIELDYKFPLVVGSQDNVRNDISEASSSMEEIIDLSFTIASLKTIGLGKMPIFLDEFGSAMDAAHKAKTARMIDDMIEHESFEQIFVISHDIAQYSSLDNTEVCILHSENVIIPNGCAYNQHVEFD